MIKLHRCSVLASLVGAFACDVPRAVYEEVVTRGKDRLYQDAEAIDAILKGSVTIIEAATSGRPEMGLGAGEVGILEALSNEENPIVISDDRRFLTLLSQRGIPFLTPADVLVTLARRGILKRAEAIESLERLRPLIRASAYHETREDLVKGREP